VLQVASRHRATLDVAALQERLRADPGA
jgi:hypothetical protein